MNFQHRLSVGRENVLLLFAMSTLDALQARRHSSGRSMTSVTHHLLIDAWKREEQDAAKQRPLWGWRSGAKGCIITASSSYAMSFEDCNSHSQVQILTMIINYSVGRSIPNHLNKYLLLRRPKHWSQRPEMQKQSIMLASNNDFIVFIVFPTTTISKATGFTQLRSNSNIGMFRSSITANIV